MSKKDYNNKYDSISGKNNKSFYKPDKKDQEYTNNLNNPGEYPYTRGIHDNMYGKPLWWDTRRTKADGSARLGID